MRGKKAGGRKPGSKNKATLAMEAAAAAAVGGNADPRALPTLTKILRAAPVVGKFKTIVIDPPWRYDVDLAAAEAPTMPR